jgi:hypothetical protein
VSVSTLVPRLRSGRPAGAGEQRELAYVQTYACFLNRIECQGLAGSVGRLVLAASYRNGEYRHGHDEQGHQTE